MSDAMPELEAVMERAVDACIAHVDAGGLPFVGVVVGPAGEVVSGFGVNRVAETGNQMAHAEIVAMREALATTGGDDLTGTTLLATGEPCGLCYRFAIEHGIERILIAVDRDEVAGFGFDYRSSYLKFGVTDAQRVDLARPLPITRRTDPFTRYLTRNDPGRASARPDTDPKGASS